MKLLRTVTSIVASFAMSLVLLCLIGLANSNVHAQSITKIVVPYPPGGSADVLARLLVDQVSQSQSVPMMIENRPGAGTIIATEAVSRAAPDGHTLLINANSFVINPNLQKVNYDPLTNFEPICYLVKSPQIIVVNSASPYRKLVDLLDAARSKPGELSLGSVGPGTTQHIAIEQLKRAANVNLIYVPFPGGAPAITALLGAHINAVLGNYSEVVAYLESGKLRALATTSSARIAPLPDLPTIAETGYKDYEAEVWFGLMVPAGTPKDRTTQLALWFTAAMQTPQVNSRLVALGLYPVGMCGDDYRAFIGRKFDEYARVIRESNIKAE